MSKECCSNDKPCAADKEKSRDLAVQSKKIVLPISTEIPSENVKITKLKDGYAVRVEEKSTNKGDHFYSESSYSYASEEHFGKPVKSVAGGFNEKGVYEIKVDFDEVK